MNNMKRVKVIGVSWKFHDQTFTAAQLERISHPTISEVADWLDTFGHLVGKGVPILSILSELAEKTNNLRLRALTIEIDANVREGECIGTTVYEFNWCKLPIVAQLIDLGEELGSLDETLATAAKLHRCEFKHSEISPVQRSTYASMFFKFGILLETGLPILRILKLLQAEASSADSISANLILGEDLLVVCDEIEVGSTLSKAFAVTGNCGDAIINALEDCKEVEDFRLLFSSWFEEK